MKCEQLTEKQNKVYAYIKEFILTNNGTAPSQTQIAQACSIRQGNITKVLTALENKSCIHYSRYKTRGVELL
jgi:SOS-response transcriptional repressor LexA